MIDEKLLIDIRNYLKMKTGIYYFKDIRKTPDNLQVTCPYHKGGQERKPSATIRITPSNRTTIGMFHCFTCDESKPLDIVIKDLLGPLYDEDEVESLKGQAAAVDNFANFFAQNCFPAASGVVLIQGTLSMYQEVTLSSIAATAIPIAIITVVITIIQVLLYDRKLKKVGGK